MRKDGEAGRDNRERERERERREESDGDGGREKTQSDTQQRQLCFRSDSVEIDRQVFGFF